MYIATQVLSKLLVLVLGPMPDKSGHYFHTTTLVNIML